MTAPNGYKRNGFDGGTRFRFAADYYLFDDISWISWRGWASISLRYLTGIIIMPEGATDTTRRMLYRLQRARRGGADLRSTEQHLLRCGGRKTDIWDYDI